MKKGLLILSIIILVIFFFLFARFTGLVVTSINTCSDTDNGKDYGVKGKVFGAYYLFTKQDFLEEDYCKDEGTLVEYYCVAEGNGLHSYKQEIKYKCKSGCEDGICLGEEQASEVNEIPKKFSFLNKIKNYLNKLF